jgi:hypothetical protein
MPVALHGPEMLRSAFPVRKIELLTDPVIPDRKALLE